ncbi:MAG TPA: hypothetical protein VJA25_00275 [Dehalococcoidia bacterium]|nr:hypothetical protein [Dehalococcoidia bacterium]
MQADDEVLVILEQQGAERRRLGEELLEQRPHLVSEATTALGSHIYHWRYPCGHEHRTMLLTPPRNCPTCRGERYARDDEELLRHRIRALDARNAADQAERAHTYRRPHLICQRCVDSRSADALTLTEAHAGIFSKRTPRGFKGRENE